MPTTTVTQNATSHADSETKSEKIYMTQKIQEIEENGKTNNIRDLYKGVNSLRIGY